MSRKGWIVIAVVGGLLLTAGAAGAAASWYWRGGQYVLPRYNQTAALQDILTEHKNQIDALTAADYQAQINALNAALTAHVGNTTSAHNYDARFVRHFHASGTMQLLGGWVYANGNLQTQGGGFTVSRTATGTYSLQPSNTMGDWPTAVITPMDVDPPCFVRWNSISTSGQINFSLRDQTLLLNSDQEWCFTLTGPH